MKKRYLYVLLFGVPGFFLSLIIAFTLFGMAAGFLWLFVFGDNPWPAAIETTAPLLLVLAFMVFWIAFIFIGYTAGKKFEADPVWNKRHLLASVGLTIVPIVFIVLHQLSVGNIGTKSDGRLCNDFCKEKGYAASGMPPRDSGERSCLCYDDSGHEILKVPIEAVTPSK
jgi:hypothetical protein